MHRVSLRHHFFRVLVCQVTQLLQLGNDLCEAGSLIWVRVHASHCKLLQTKHHAISTEPGSAVNKGSMAPGQSPLSTPLSNTTDLHTLRGPRPTITTYAHAWPRNLAVGVWQPFTSPAKLMLVSGHAEVQQQQASDQLRGHASRCVSAGQCLEHMLHQTWCPSGIAQQNAAGKQDEMWQCRSVLSSDITI